MFWNYFLQEKVGHFQYLYTPNCGKFNRLFQKMTLSLTKVTPKYENILVMGDFNIDKKCKGVGSNNLSDFCDIFHLTNIVKSDTCFTKTHTSPIDLVTNRHLLIKHLSVKPILVITIKWLQHFSNYIFVGLVSNNI